MIHYQVFFLYKDQSYQPNKTLAVVMRSNLLEENIEGAVEEFAQETSFLGVSKVTSATILNSSVSNTL